MDIKTILSTLIGGFLFTFLIQTFWGRLVKKFGSFGGIIAATFIPGTMWVLNHGISSPLIFQRGVIWIDMAWAPAIGGITYSLLMGKKLKKSFSNIIAAIIGGLFAGIVISTFN